MLVIAQVTKDDGERGWVPVSRVFYSPHTLRCAVLTSRAGMRVVLVPRQSLRPILPLRLWFGLWCICIHTIENDPNGLGIPVKFFFVATSLLLGVWA